MPRCQWRDTAGLLNSHTETHPLSVDPANKRVRCTAARLLSSKRACIDRINCSLPGDMLTGSIRHTQRPVNSAKLSQTNYPVRQYGIKILINGYFRRCRSLSSRDRILSVIVAVAHRLANRSRG